MSSPLFPLLLAATLAASPALATAKGASKVHVVGPGQHLGGIAKRYGVSVPALQRANSLGAKSVIRPGQRLTIPNEKGQDDAPAVTNARAVVRSSDAEPSPLRSLPAAGTHRVARGETLSQLALRYDTDVPTLLVLNRLRKQDAIREGQSLTVPVPGPPAVSPGESSRSGGQPTRIAGKDKAGASAWQRYTRPVKQRGYLELATPITRFAGQVVDSRGRLQPAAVRALNNMLGAGGTRPALPERLIRLLVTVSDTFGGRPIRVVSGFRTTSYYQDSRHKLSSAVDFTIAGVPNAVVCEYLRGFDDVGVGYYPNSTFVHLDVRGHSAYWVDYSGPGEAPRSSPNTRPRPTERARKVRRPEDRKMLADLDALLSQATAALHDVGESTANGARAKRSPRGLTQE